MDGGFIGAPVFVAVPPLPVCVLTHRTASTRTRARADADRELRSLLAYPLEETLGCEEAAALLGGDLQEVAAALLAAHASGELAEAVQGGHDTFKVRGLGGSRGGRIRGWGDGLGWAALPLRCQCTPLFTPPSIPLPLLPACHTPQKWLTGMGKAQGRKGKRLFLPVRIACTGRLHGPDVGEVLGMLALVREGDVAEAGAYVALPQRMEQLAAWLAANPAPPAAAKEA